MSEYADIVGVKIFKGVAFGNEATYFKLDDKVYAFREDEDDGYRSYGVFEGEALPQQYANEIFNLEHQPIEVLVFENNEKDDFNGIYIFGNPEMCGERKNYICKLGTDHVDDYYPMCTAEFNSVEATECSRLQDNFIAESILLSQDHHLNDL